MMRWRYERMLAETAQQTEADRAAGELDERAWCTLPMATGPGFVPVQFLPDPYGPDQTVFGPPPRGERSR